MQPARDSSQPPVVYPRRNLARATLAAAAVATVLLVTIVLPAEYGVDPLRTGRALGLTRFNDSGVSFTPVDGGADLLYSFTLSWQLEEQVLIQQEGMSTVAGAEQEIPFRFEGTNLTHMTATLTWLDDDQVGGQATAADTFDIRLRGPDGRSPFGSAPNDQNGRGEVSIGYPWRDAPTPGPDANGTYRIDGAPDTTAQGDWSVAVRALQLGGNDAGDDPGNAWTLTVKARTYGLSNVAAFGSDRPTDRVVFGLAPGGSLEYKFGMESGAAMTYRWTSTAPLRYDFHGDTGPAEEPTSYEQDSASQAAGEFTAPFSGRHGWYWKNEGTEPVQITLETQGAYAVLGVV